MKLLNVLLIALIAISSTWAKEKFFVVERESSSLATIFNGLKRTNIEGMHNMNHGVVKFRDKDGYVISRDGYVIKFDPESEKILAEYKTSKSAIGFVIGKNYVAVANYDDKSVDILTRDLEPIKKIKTNSKNVGIKIQGPGSGRDTAVKSIGSIEGITVKWFKDVTPLPHNGCRPPKRRRV